MEEEGRTASLGVFVGLGALQNAVDWEVETPEIYFP